MTVEIRYGVIFGKGDSTDWIPRSLTLTDEEAIIYSTAVEHQMPLNEVQELQTALQRAYEQIESEEISIGIDNGDEFVLECQGEAEMDPDELNALVHARDVHALEFFGLNDADDNALEEWDAYDLDGLPLIKNFIEDFKSYSPYDAGWSLSVEFVDSNNLD